MFTEGRRTSAIRKAGWRWGGQRERGISYRRRVRNRVINGRMQGRVANTPWKRRQKTILVDI